MQTVQSCVTGCLLVHRSLSINIITIICSVISCARYLTQLQRRLLFHSLKRANHNSTRSSTYNSVRTKLNILFLNGCKCRTSFFMCSLEKTPIRNHTYRQFLFVSQLCYKISPFCVLFFKVRSPQIQWQEPFQAVTVPRHILSTPECQRSQWTPLSRPAPPPGNAMKTCPKITSTWRLVSSLHSPQSFFLPNKYCGICLFVSLLGAGWGWTWSCL